MFSTERGQREINREYLDNIEALVFGKDKKEAQSTTKRKKKVELAIPKTRDWDFMDWIRQYEQDQTH